MTGIALITFCALITRLSFNTTPILIYEKTKILSNTRGGGVNSKLIIGDKKIEEVEEIKYLVQIIFLKKKKTET